jgi:flagellar hook-basal body complex protein FliE
MLGRRLTIPLIITASVVAGGTAGAFLGVPGLSGASTTSPVEALAAGPTTRGPERKSALFEAAAKALNLTTDELRQKLSDGKTTIADIAKQENIDVNKVIDAMAAADRQRIEDIVNNPLPARDHGPGKAFEKPFGAEQKFDAAAKALGITTDELRSALRGGKTIADIAKDKNIDVNKVIDAMVAAAQARMDEAKANGKITPAQADRLKSEVKDRITRIVNGEGGGAPGGPGRGFWGHRAP